MVAILATAQLIINFATWNLRGIGSPDTPNISREVEYNRILRREQLAMDCCRYGLDIVGLQETEFEF